ncbi:MAG: hypothetical protein CL946_11600 [Ectothiorhodospiraceae bacterium]|nr:hypothetical protein [Ectothiorhodospiraceae bacterium]
MSFFDFAAVLGALAWIPPIGKWLYQLVTKPVVTMIPSRDAEVGYTTYGPILNLSYAFTSKHKDIIIDNITLKVQHAEGDTHIFQWTGLNETFSEITDSYGNKQVVSKDRNPIALKVGVGSLTEIFIRFQEESYRKAHNQLLSALLAKINHLRNIDPVGFIESVFLSSEYLKLKNHYKNSFWWRVGKYTVTIKLESTSKHQLQSNAFSFELLDLEVSQLRDNVETASSFLDEHIQSYQPGYDQQTYHWNWANISVEY